MIGAAAIALCLGIGFGSEAHADSPYYPPGTVIGGSTEPVPQSKPNRRRSWFGGDRDQKRQPQAKPRRDRSTSQKPRKTIGTRLRSLFSERDDQSREADQMRDRRPQEPSPVRPLERAASNRPVPQPVTPATESRFWSVGKASTSTQQPPAPQLTVPRPIDMRMPGQPSASQTEVANTSAPKERASKPKMETATSTIVLSSGVEDLSAPAVGQPATLTPPDELELLPPAPAPPSRFGPRSRIAYEDGGTTTGPYESGSGSRRRLGSRRSDINYEMRDIRDIRPFPDYVPPIDQKLVTSEELPPEELLTELPYSGRFMQPKVYAWEATNLFYRPLYFNDPLLERYGYALPEYVQPVASITRFTTQLGFLPYQMTVHPPCEPISPLGWYRPGDVCTPAIHPAVPINPKAIAVQAAVTTGLFFLIP